MRDYELVLVIDPDISGEDQKKLLIKVQKLIEDLKGRVEKTVEWGQKTLSYPIKKKKLGYYFLLEIKMPVDGLAKIENGLKMEEKIIRYLLVKKH